MKRIMSIMMVLLLSGVFAFAQQSGRERRIAAEKKAAQERSRSMGGFRSGNDVKDDNETPKAATQRPAALEEITPSNQPDPNDDSGDKVNKDNSSATSSGNNTSTENEKAGKSNAPVVLQRTTSESGSPSVLSKDNGRGRDGTNSVQRASYNMAGAEVPANMNLSQKNKSERNMNTGTRIRKQEEQPQKTLSKQTQRDNKQQVAAQQRSDEQAKNKADDKKKTKSQKKNRRNKDRDSG